MEEQKTKICTKCGREKPLEDFPIHKTGIYGRRPACKECSAKSLREYKESKLKKIFTNPELSKFTPRQLMEELRARGYSGELTYIQKIKL